MTQPDEGEQDTLHIKLTNHLTGEITEVEVRNAEQAKNLLVELNASDRTIGKAKESLRYYLDRFLGADEQYQFADGKLLKRVQRTTLQYQVASLRKVLDEDQLEVCLKVDVSTANQLIQEMMEKGELPPGTLKQIRDEADQINTKPYVVLQ